MIYIDDMARSNGAVAVAEPEHVPRSRSAERKMLVDGLQKAKDAGHGVWVLIHRYSGGTVAYQAARRLNTLWDVLEAADQGECARFQFGSRQIPGPPWPEAEDGEPQAKSELWCRMLR